MFMSKEKPQLTSARHSRQRIWSAWLGPQTRALRRKRIKKIPTNKADKKINQKYNWYNKRQTRALNEDAV